MFSFMMAVLNGRLARLERDEEGATAVEYGLLLAFIAGVLVITIIAVGGKVTDWFTSVNSTPW